jgi:UDP-N-acetylmuramoyl-L-alanyl-D-glutamate--2,6-diaminopimelate ligase
MTIAYQFGAEIDLMVKQAAALPPVPGRLEFIPNNLGLLVVVDYAHTDDALNKTLHCLKELKPKKLLVVFGCGGDRDKGKRAKMGMAAENYADFIVITNDNPRTENPDEIIKDIKFGLTADKAVIEKDRQKAIKIAMENAGEGDVLLIAGKGHETYQEINRVYHHFDDREIIREIIAELEKPNVY